MKTTTLFFVFLFSFFYSTAQDSKGTDENFFFKIEFDSARACYGKCLVQSKWEIITKEEIVSYERIVIKPKTYYEYDTIKTDYFFLQENIPNLKYIVDFVDTSSQYIMISQEDRKLEISPANYETVTEQYIYRKESKSWIYSGSNKIHDSANWKLKMISPKYKARKKHVVRYGGNTREIVIPAEYKTIIKLTLKENISTHELNNIKLFCDSFYLQRVRKYNMDTITVPAKIKLVEEMKLIFPSKTEYRRISCDMNLDIISKIQKQLFFMGFYSGNFQGKFTDKTKEAIINYQVKNNLPIGQLDEVSVAYILKQKTPFNR